MSIKVKELKDLCLAFGGTLENMYQQGISKTGYIVKTNYHNEVKYNRFCQNDIDMIPLDSENDYMSIVFNADTNIIAIDVYQQVQNLSSAEYLAGKYNSDIIEL